MKRESLIACLLLVFLVSLPVGVVAEKIKITQFMMPHHYAFSSEYYNEMKAKFEALHPDVTIEITAAANLGDYEQKAMVSTASGVIYDVFVPPIVSFVSLAAQGIFADLTPFAERDRDMNLRDFVGMSISAVTLDNQLLGIPFGMTMTFSLSNAQMFKEAGLATPVQLGSNWDWASMNTIATKMARDTSGDGTMDVRGLTTGFNFERVLPVFIHNAGGDVFESQVLPRHSTFSTDPAVVKGLQAFLDLAQRDLVSRRLQDWNEGKVALSFNHLPETINAFVKNSGTPWEWEVFHYPKGPARQGSELLTFNYSMNRHAPHKDMVWEWVKFLTIDRENVRGVMKAWGNPPAYLPSMPDYFKIFSPAAGYPDSYRVIADILQHPDARVQVVTPVYTPVRSEFTKKLADVISGQENVKNFLINMDRFAQSKLDAIYKD